MSRMPGLSIKLLSAALAVSLLFGSAWAQDAQPTTSLKLNTASEKVPAGTMLAISFNTAMDSRISEIGEPFSAYIQQDFSTPDPHGHSRVILPKGAMVRGRIENVKKPGLFSRGGTILLSFDHVVLPSGDLLPLDLNLSARNEVVKRVNAKGEEDRYALYADPGVGYKIHKGLESGVQTFDKLKDAGFEAGKDIAGGAGMVVTVPAAVLGGVVAGTAVTTGKGVKGGSRRIHYYRAGRHGEHRFRRGLRPACRLGAAAHHILEPVNNRMAIAAFFFQALFFQLPKALKQFAFFAGKPGGDIHLDLDKMISPALGMVQMGNAMAFQGKHVAILGAGGNFNPFGPV
jgi:hypothetical protein